jgi:hypothetical protein
MTPKLGNGIEADATGIGIPASCISFRYQYPYFGTGLVPALAFLFIFLYRTDRVPYGPAFRHLENLLNLERDPNCRWWKGMHTARPYTAAVGAILHI